MTRGWIGLGPHLRDILPYIAAGSLAKDLIVGTPFDALGRSRAYDIMQVSGKEFWR